MKKIFLSASLFLSGIFAFAQNGKVINDKNAEKRNVSGFHAVSISNGIDLYISQGDEAVAVSASDIDYRNRIKTEVENGVLKIYIENHGLHWNSDNKKMKVYVSCKDIDRLHASGGSDVFVEGTIKGSNLDIMLSGGSDLTGRIDVSDLSLNQSGGSDASVSGTVVNLKVHSSGGSDFHGYDLSSDNCTIDASGGSDAEVTVNKQLDADAGGGSDIHYKGAGVLRNSHTGGSASISKRG